MTARDMKNREAYKKRGYLDKKRGDKVEKSCYWDIFDIVW